MSYKSFIVEFSGRIIKRLKRENDWTTTKANNYLKSKFKHDDTIIRIIGDIIREEEPKIILNRNPESFVGL